MKKWHLDIKEVALASPSRQINNDEFDVVLCPDEKHNHLPSGPGYRHGLKQPRSFNKTDHRIVMLHLPTGVEAYGRFTGFYSRKEGKAINDLLLQKLFKALEDKVAKHLKVAGR